MGYFFVQQYNVILIVQRARGCVCVCIDKTVVKCTHKRNEWLIAKIIIIVIRFAFLCFFYYYYFED